LNWVLIVTAGLAFGLGAVLLVQSGNPGNYGFCAACHLRDIAGSLGIQNVPTLQYARPEVFGWIIGAFGLATVRGEFRPRGGSSAPIRFFLALFMMLGALVFLGCPLRALLRLAGGDLNGLTALAGFIAGIGSGIFFLKRGFSLGKAETITSSVKWASYLPVAAALGMAIAVYAGASFLNFSKTGPGSQHAPILISLIAGLITGALAQRTRMCLSGGFRDFILVRDTYLLSVYGVIFVSAIAANVFFGTFKLGFTGQPLAHTMHVWNFMGLYLTGISAVLLGGCPLRQMIMAAEGNLDAVAAILGMLAGAGIAHGFNLAASGAGVPVYGQVAVIVGIAAVAMVGWQFKDAQLASVS